MAAVLAAPLVGLGLSTTAATTIATVGLYAATTAASIFLQMAMAEEPKEEIGTKLTAVLGGAVNQSVHIGTKETAGSFIYKGAWGRAGKVPNAFLTRVYCLSDRPVEGFEPYVWVDGIKATYNPDVTDSVDGVNIGHPINKFNAHGGHKLWVKFHDGSQSGADSYLTTKFGTGDRAWTEDHVGRGRAYMIVTQKYDKKAPTGEVEVLAVVNKSRLYDFRDDSTNGGSGLQRYGTYSTYEVDPGNPIIAGYNVMRGIYRNDEWMYGGQKWPAPRFDNDTWTAAANQCDTDVGNKDGGNHKWARVGAEIDVSEEPWSVIERMLKACNGRLVESGGKFKVYVGGIGASVYSFTDDDVIASEEFTGRLFPTRDQIANTVNGTYTEPANAGEAKAYKPRTNDDYVDEDGDVRKMTLDFEYVRENRQAQRMAKFALNDNRRFRTFQIAFWSQARKLEPCDVISWSSDRFQFTNKKFICGDVVLRDDGIVVVNVREADANDANWTPISDEDPFTTGVFEDIDEPTQTFSATVTGVALTDDAGNPRRPAIRIQATLDDDFVDCEALRVQVRKKFGDQKVIFRKLFTEFFDQTDVDDGDPDNLDYGDITFTSQAIATLKAKWVQVRYKIKPESDRKTEWTDWADHEINLADLGIDDNDTSDDLLAAPTGLSVTKVQEKDEDGTIRTFLKLNCTAPAWAGEKAEFIYEVIVASDDTYRVKSKSEKARFRVNRTNRLHTVRARARNGVGQLSNWTSSVSLTPSKKSTDASAVTGISISRKNGSILIKWDRISDPDNREVAIYRGTTNVFGSMTEIGRTKSTKWRDDDNITKGTRYYYRVLPVDTSDNVGSTASAAVDDVETGIDDGDTDDTTLAAPTGLTVTKVQDKDEDGTIRTFLKLDCTPPGWATTKTSYVYSVTVGADEFTVKSDDTKARFRVNKTGVLHTVKVRGIKGVGTKGSWSSTTGITPAKKAADASAVTGLSTHKKNGDIIVKWNPIADRDNAEYIVKRATVNSYGSSTEIARIKGTRYRDSDVNTKNTTYYYFIDPVDTSGNVGTSSASVSNTETGIGTSDTDASVLAAPTSLSLVQANRDVNRDGSVDTALLATISGLVANAAGYEIWYEDNAGQVVTARADSGYYWFMANTTRSYRVRWRTINWVGQAGSWSGYTSYVTPTALSSSPNAPTGVFASAGTLSVYIGFDLPTDADYFYSEIGISNGVSSIGLGTNTSGGGEFYLGAVGFSGYYGRVRHFRRSNTTPSAWSNSSAFGTVSGLSINELGANSVSKTQLIAGAAAETSKANLGTSGTGSTSVSASCTSVMSVATFKATSTTAGVTITLEGDSWTVDLTDQKMYTFCGRRTGGGNVNLSKSGGGTISGCVLVATGVY